MTTISSLGVFCGSRTGAEAVFAADAERLGRIMAERGVRLVFGGGRIGLMGVLADAVLSAGGEAVGVIPDFLKDLEVGNDGVTEQIVTGSMHERKSRMFDLSDGFAVLPGGLGTLDEALEIVTWKQLRLHSKPIVVLDTLGYWQALEALMRRAVEAGFAHEGVMELVTVVKTPDDVFPALAAAPEPSEEVLTSHL